MPIARAPPARTAILAPVSTIARAQRADARASRATAALAWASPEEIVGEKGIANAGLGIGLYK